MWTSAAGADTYVAEAVMKVPPGPPDVVDAPCAPGPRVVLRSAPALRVQTPLATVSLFVKSLAPTVNNPITIQRTLAQFMHSSKYLPRSGCLYRYTPSSSTPTTY